MKEKEEEEEGKNNCSRTAVQALRKEKERILLQFNGLYISTQQNKKNRKKEKGKNRGKNKDERKTKIFSSKSEAKTN